VGAALAAKLRGLEEVHAIYFGDGATSTGGFHAGLNMAGVWKVPAVFVCVDNGWAISVPSSAQTAQSDYALKGLAYGVPGQTVDGNDVLACHAAMSALVQRAREGGGPALLVVQTYRMKGHSSSDDPSKYRDAGEVALWERRDPLRRYARFLEKRGLLGAGEIERLEAGVLAEIDAVIREQEAAPPMPLRSLVEDVYAQVPAHLRRQFNDFLRIATRYGEARPGDGAFPL
jgi:TPP-dependent pyruvate/acetoin dehydrogenase alpha subunit